MTNSPEKKLVAEALKDCRVNYRGGWALLGLTAQQAIILSRCVQILCTRETPRSGMIACDELNTIRRIIDSLPADAEKVA
jgi:hypothetical protein